MAKNNRVVSHPKNRGVGAAFRTGRDQALADGADYLIHMDSDGQVDPAEIPVLFDPVQRGEADLTLGSRFLGGSRPENLDAWKAVGLSTAARLIGLSTGYRLTDISCGFRCMNRRLIEVVRPTFDYDYIQETLIQALAAGARVLDVPVHVKYEKEPARAGMASTSSSKRALPVSSAWARVSPRCGHRRARSSAGWLSMRPASGRGASGA